MIINTFTYTLIILCILHLIIHIYWICTEFITWITIYTLYNYIFITLTQILIFSFTTTIITFNWVIFSCYFYELSRNTCLTCFYWTLTNIFNLYLSWTTNYTFICRRTYIICIYIWMISLLTFSCTYLLIV